MVTLYFVEHPPINLSQVVTGDALRQVAGDPSVAEQLQSLLPETGEDPVAVVSSPQFQQVSIKLVLSENARFLLCM